MPEPKYALFKVTASVLTPLHIGSGRELLNEYDYAVFNRQTWRINDSALLEAQNVDDPAFINQLMEVPPAQLLKDADFVAGSPYFRYVIRGTPRSQAEGAQLRELIKDTFDRLYLPGSSLKGAIRTALAWYAWGQKGLQPQMEDLGARREWAAQNYEHTLFGPNPNKDALRALHVSDSAPVSAEQMVIINAVVLNASGKLDSAIPVELEAIRADTSFDLTIKIDLALYSDWAKRYRLDLPGLEWFLQLPQVLQAHARQRVNEEAEWFSRQPDAPRLLAFYNQLAAARLESNQALVQLGWGTGWDGMTLGSRLRTNPAFMREMVAKFRLSKSRQAGGDYPEEGSKFPKSRRSAVNFSITPDGRRVFTPAVPLGWLLLTFEPLVGIPEDWQRLATPIEMPPVIHVRPVRPVQPAQPAQPQQIQVPYPVPVPEKQAPPSAPQPVLRPPEPKIVVIQSFTAQPAVGDRFKGTVIDSESNGKITLQIPGIDPDEQGMAVIPPKNNPAGKVYKENRVLLCQVESVRVEKGGFYWVICTLE